VKIRLDRLHLVLQAAMGWTNSHLFEFRVGDVGWGVRDPDFGGCVRQVPQIGGGHEVGGADHAASRS
jgi:hypothetical protein